VPRFAQSDHGDETFIELRVGGLEGGKASSMVRLDLINDLIVPTFFCR
jgi:hypothetical protein